MTPEDAVTAPVIAVDLQVDTWKIPEARAFRGAVGVNAEFAAAAIQAAFVAAEKQARDEFGEKVDEPGWEPPWEWVPPALLNIDPDYLLGFAWIAARRADPALDYDAFAESLVYSELVAGFWAAIVEAARDALPLEPNRAARRSRGPASKTASSSPARTTGPSKKSTPSHSASSPLQSRS
jgi:hypothetical protein